MVSSSDPPTYWQDIRPILRKHCTACHNARKVGDVDISGGLALDSYEAVLKGSRQKVVHPGKSGDSPLVQLVASGDEEKRMPLGGKPLPPETVALLRRWIDSGAAEGKRPDEADTAVVTTAARPRRKLEVRLPTNAVPPAGVFGGGKPARLELALPVGPLAPATAVAFSPDGKLLASGSYGLVTVWDLAAVRPVRVLTQVLGAVNDLRFSPDGKLLAVAGGQPSAKGDLRLFQTTDWKLQTTLVGHDDVVFGVAFSPDGKHLASASFDKTVRIWDVTGHKLERTLTGHSDFVYAVAFSPDGKWLASAGKDRAVKVVEVATGRGKFTFSGGDTDVLAVAIHPDGKSVVSAGFDPALSWWNADTGERTQRQGGHGVAVHELCFSPDGKLLISAGGDGTARVWDGARGGSVRSLPVGSMTYAVAVRPDGKCVGTGSADGLVRLWDVATGRHLLSLLALPTDWLAVTPEGYVASSPALQQQGHWRMGPQDVAAWDALTNPDAVAQAVRGAPLPTPIFQKKN